MLQGDEGAGRGTCWRLWRSLDLLGDKERKAQDSTDPWLSQASLLSPSSSPAWNAPLVLSPPGLGLRHGTEQASRAEDFPCFFPSICVHPCDVELLPFHTEIRSGLLRDPDVCLVLSFPAESHGDTGRGRGTVSGSTQSSELSTPSSLYMEYGEYSEPESGRLLLVMHCSALLAWVCTFSTAYSMLRCLLLILVCYLGYPSPSVLS